PLVTVARRIRVRFLRALAGCDDAHPITILVVPEPDIDALSKSPLLPGRDELPQSRSHCAGFRAFPHTGDTNSVQRRRFRARRSEAARRTEESHREQRGVGWKTPAAWRNPSHGSGRLANSLPPCLAKCMSPPRSVD